ncbi:ubiquitin-like protein 7 [Liolophura sinensis]|uniref:ubiquitin-like protein 7 n=1 Tax=Liolophura sinensis TaxID=3198878 RepID=UPI003159699D
MASLAICDRTSKKNERLTVTDVNTQGNVADLKELVSEKINVPPKDIELVYCGQCLQDQKTVDCYGVKSGSTVYALRKQHPKEETAPKSLTDADIRHFKTVLRTALINPAYQATVEKLIADPHELESLMNESPGLEHDPVALAMLYDPELLALLINPVSINNVLEAHPALAQAAINVSAKVSEEGGKATSANGAGSSAGTYSLDQMSDEEDNMAPSQPSGSAAGGQGITTSQLAAALSAATGGISSPGTSRQSDSQSRITADFFQQALLQAQGAHATPPDPNTIQVQLQQLRDMGIADEDVARRALQATGGDIQMALDLIFGDGNF